jgi:hypothetical protein
MGCEDGELLRRAQLEIELLNKTVDRLTLALAASYRRPGLDFELRERGFDDD